MNGAMAMEKEELLPLIISQLQHFNLPSIAQVVAEATSTPHTFAPSSKLAELCHLGSVALNSSKDVIMASTGNERDDDADNTAGKPAGLVIDIDAVQAASKPLPNYYAYFTTMHKGPVRSACFSHDGRFFATCSADASLKVLDVQKIKDSYPIGGAAAGGEPVEKPVIRTMYDHLAGINDVAFHPNGTVLASCSDDATIKLYDLQKPTVKRSFRFLQDSVSVRSISFHPSGDFIISGTEQELLRIYDVQTMKCYTPQPGHDSEDSIGGINMVRYAPKGNFCATARANGSIQLHDTVSGRIINTIRQAHGGASVSSICFSSNGRYLVSTGLDSLPRMWDLNTGKIVQTFDGAAHNKHAIGAAFTFNDEYVISTDEDSLMVVCWDARTGVMKKYPGGHQTTMKSVAASPVDAGFVTSGDDCRARYWNLMPDKK